MHKKIIIGSRGSKLALIYAQNAKDKIIQNTNLNDEDVLIKEITTKGDQFQDVRLSEVGGKGLFTTNIEKELQDKKIDIAVHALKDRPAIETVGLRTDTFLKRNDPREIFITKNKKKTQRIKKLNDGLYDAIILSYAGIKSLTIEDKITEVFSTEEIIPVSYTHLTLPTTPYV